MLRIKDHHRKHELKNFWKTEKHEGERALCNISEEPFLC